MGGGGPAKEINKLAPWSCILICKCCDGATRREDVCHLVEVAFLGEQLLACSFAERAQEIFEMGVVQSSCDGMGGKPEKAE